MDLVAELRAYKGQWCTQTYGADGNLWTQGSFTPDEAADEIERLRRCRSALEAVMRAHGPGTLASDELYAMAVDALKEG